MTITYKGVKYSPDTAHLRPTSRRTITLTDEQHVFLNSLENASWFIRQLIDKAMKEGADNVSI